MKVDRFTKAVLTGIFLCLALLTLKEYDIISDAEAAKAGITNVNIARINGRPIYPHNVMHPSAYFGLPVVIHQPSVQNLEGLTPVYQNGQGRLRVVTMPER